MSPDGATIATLATVADQNRPGDLTAGIAAVDLIDVVSGQRRRLWPAPGGWSSDTVSWSPDGQLIAACHARIGDTFATVIIDTSTSAENRAVWHNDYSYLPHSPNGVWLGDRELVYFTADGTLHASHLDHGDRHLLAPPVDTHGHVLGTLEDRIIWVDPVTHESTSTHFVTTDLHGRDRRPERSGPGLIRSVLLAKAWTCHSRGLCSRSSNWGCGSISASTDNAVAFGLPEVVRRPGPAWSAGGLETGRWRPSGHHQPSERRGLPCRPQARW